jgi:hypothetical protein
MSEDMHRLLMLMLSCHLVRTTKIVSLRWMLRSLFFKQTIDGVIV